VQWRQRRAASIGHGDCGRKSCVGMGLDRHRGLPSCVLRLVRLDDEVEPEPYELTDDWAGWLPERRDVAGSHQVGLAPKGSMTRSSALA
jgi:hypothetical protein